MVYARITLLLLCCSFALCIKATIENNTLENESGNDICTSYNSIPLSKEDLQSDPLGYFEKVLQCHNTMDIIQKFNRIIRQPKSPVKITFAHMVNNKKGSFGSNYFLETLIQRKKFNDVH